MTPTVTVVMPVFNVERTLASAIHSVLAQTFGDLELVIVDDGSSDRSPAIAASFSDPRVRIIEQANRGLAGARNTGIRRARGRFVAFLDSDDLWHPQKLEHHVAHLEARPEVGVSYSASAMIDDRGQPLGLSQSPKLTDITPEHLFCRNPVGNGSAPVIRREALDAIAFLAVNDGAIETWWFDETFRQSEDIECWLRISATTDWRFEGIGAELTYYRINESGLSANLLRQFAAWERLFAKVAVYAPALVRRSGARARAYQLRYLGRRAVRLGDGAAALALSARALRTSPRILIEEPLRTLTTLAAAALLAAAPRSIFTALESTARAFASRRPAAA